ncbi:MAG TPA: hypothetical protein VJZ32_04125 [Candidatus Bathyarchaeia archaeon]|nr:hypothetical protein [Candidatus Bathyarchaeia archaeon]
MKEKLRERCGWYGRFGLLFLPGGDDFLDLFGPVDFSTTAVAVFSLEKYLMLTVLAEEPLLTLNTFSYSHMRHNATFDGLSICSFTPLGTQIWARVIVRLNNIIAIFWIT